MSDEQKDFSLAPYLAVAPNYYGRGFTVAEAKANLKAQGARLTQHVVYKMPPGATKAHISPMGQLSWTWADDADTDGQPEVVASHGVKL